MSYWLMKYLSVIFPLVTLFQANSLLKMFKLICEPTKLILIKSFVNISISKWHISNTCAYQVMCRCAQHTHVHTGINRRAHRLSLPHLLILPSYQRAIIVVRHQFTNTIHYFCFPLYCSRRKKNCYFLALSLSRSIYRLFSC